MIGATRDPERLRDLSRTYMPVGKHVTIIGGGLVGVELAEFMVERGRDVTVLEEGPTFATEMAHPRRWRVLHDLREAGVHLIDQATVTRIDEHAVHYETGPHEGHVTPEEVPANTVVIATGLVANPELADALLEQGITPIVIGDCQGVGYIEGAIRDGYHAALEIGDS
jgi:2,4-dienoyl-CoA reductase (NADPH2)